jgi:hypothetical protein
MGQAASWTGTRGRLERDKEETPIGGPFGHAVAGTEAQRRAAVHGDGHHADTTRTGMRNNRHHPVIYARSAGQMIRGNRFQRVTRASSWEMRNNSGAIHLRNNTPDDRLKEPRRLERAGWQTFIREIRYEGGLQDVAATCGALGLALLGVPNCAAQCGGIGGGAIKLHSGWQAQPAKIRLLPAAFMRDSDHSEDRDPIVGLWHVKF